MSLLTETTAGNVVMLPTAGLPRIDTPRGFVRNAYCLGLDRIVREAWRTAASARNTATQVPDDPETQDYYERMIRALGQVSGQFLELAPEHEVRATAFAVMGFAREIQENAFIAGMTSLR
jgi:hypothetical protein